MDSLKKYNTLTECLPILEKRLEDTYNKYRQCTNRKQKNWLLFKIRQLKTSINCLQELSREHECMIPASTPSDNASNRFPTRTQPGHARQESANCYRCGNGTFSKHSLPSYDIPNANRGQRNRKWAQSMTVLPQQ